MSEYEMVPVEPTEEMILAGVCVLEERGNSPFAFRAALKAMLAAAPPADELARLEITDRQCASMLLELLTLNPWPSSDPRWQLVESWAAELLKRTNNLVRIKERGDE